MLTPPILRFFSFPHTHTHTRMPKRIRNPYRKIQLALHKYLYTNIIKNTKITRVVHNAGVCACVWVYVSVTYLCESASVCVCVSDIVEFGKCLLLYHFLHFICTFFFCHIFFICCLSKCFGIFSFVFHLKYSIYTLLNFWGKLQRKHFLASNCGRKVFWEKWNTKVYKMFRTLYAYEDGKKERWKGRKRDREKESVRNIWKESLCLWEKEIQKSEKWIQIQIRYYLV